jgi:hypothetical protein
MSHRYTKEVAPVIRRALGPIPVSSHGEEEMFGVSAPWISSGRYLQDEKFLGVVGVGKDLDMNLMDQSFTELRW